MSDILSHWKCESCGREVPSMYIRSDREVRCKVCGGTMRGFDGLMLPVEDDTTDLVRIGKLCVEQWQWYDSPSEREGAVEVAAEEIERIATEIMEACRTIARRKAKQP